MYFLLEYFIVLIFQLVYLLLAVLGLRCCQAFSLVVETGGYSPAAALEFLIAAAALAVEHGLGHMGFSSCSSV